MRSRRVRSSFRCPVDGWELERGGDVRVDVPVAEAVVLIELRGAVELQHHEAAVEREEVDPDEVGAGGRGGGERQRRCLVRQLEDALERSTERNVVEWVPVSEPAPVESISRLCGLSLRTTEGALRRLRSKRFVQLTDEGWRLAPDV